METLEAAAAAELVKNEERLKRVAERGTKAAERKAALDERYAAAERQKLALAALDADEQEVQRAEADNASAEAKVEAAEKAVAEWQKRRDQIAAENAAARSSLEMEEALETATERSRALAVALDEAKRDVARLMACKVPEETVILMEPLGTVDKASRSEALNVWTGLAVGVTQTAAPRLLPTLPTLAASDQRPSNTGGGSWNPILEKPWGSETPEELDMLAQEISAMAPLKRLPKSISTGEFPVATNVQPSFVLNAMGECCPAAVRLLESTALAIAQLASDTATTLTTSLRVPVDVRRALRNRLAAGGREPITGAVGEPFLLAAEMQITLLERAAVGGLLVGQDKLTSVVRALVVNYARDGGTDALSTIYSAMKLQVRARLPDRHAAREAVLQATSYQPLKSTTPGSFGGAIHNRRQLLLAAEAAATRAGATTGLALDNAALWLDFATCQLTDKDVDGRQVLATIRTDVLMGRLDEADSTAVEVNIDKLIVVVEAERAVRLTARALTGGASSSVTDTAAAEAKAAAAKAKVEAEARAASAAAAAASASVASPAALVLRGNLAQQTFTGICFRCGKTGHKQVACPVSAPKP